VRRGSITALIGPNGAGKTTAFNLVTGFLRPDAGRVRFGDVEVTGRRPDRIARLGMVRTFQLTRVLGKLRVIDNVLLAAPDQPGERLGTALVRPRAWRPRERDLREEAMALLAEVGIADRAEDYAATLSGGQRKLLELARLLMAEPRLVLLDEPLAGVNPVLGARLLRHMHSLRDELGTTFLFIEHDMEVVLGNADRVLVMAEGRLIASGPPAEVRRDQRVIDAYLGAHAEGLA
jgi:neutral amino acid transport system ATP-binding protein